MPISDTKRQARYRRAKRHGQGVKGPLNGSGKVDKPVGVFSTRRNLSKHLPKPWTDSDKRRLGLPISASHRTIAKAEGR